MKLNLKTILPILLISLMAFSSCKKHEIANPLDAVGAEAEAIVVANPQALYASLGSAHLANLSGRLSSDDIAQLEKLKDVKGLDFSRVVVPFYKSIGKPVIVMAVEDRGDLQKSISAMGLKENDSEGRTLYIDAGRGMSYIVDDSFLHIVPAASLSEATDMVNKLVSLGTEQLPQWKRDLLSLDKTVMSVSKAGESTVAMQMELSGKKAVVKLSNHDTGMGQKVNWMPAGSFEHIGSWASEVNKNAMLAFAVAKADYARILAPASKTLGLGLSRTEISAASAMLSGPLYGDLTLDGQSVTEFDKISANISLTSSSSLLAKAMILGISRELRNEMIPCQTSGSSFSAEFDGAKFYGKAEGDKVTLRTEYQASRSAVNPAELASCIAWASFEIPKNIIANLTDRDDFGMKGNINVYDSEIDLNLEFTDTDDTFLANLAKILK